MHTRVVYSDPYQRSLSRNHLIEKNRNPFKVTKGGGWDILEGIRVIKRQGSSVFMNEERKGRARRWKIQEEFFSTVLLHPCLLCSMCLCVCWLHFSDFDHRCLALPFVCKEDSVCPQPDFSHTVQASNTIAQHRLSKDGERRLGLICVMAKLGSHHQIWGGE